MGFWRIPKRQHDPNQTEIFEIDWTKYLKTGNTISSLVHWNVESGITKVSATNTTTHTYLKVSGGTVDETYRAPCKILTSDGRSPERSIDIVVQDM